jgi:hypothetical protein
VAGRGRKNADNALAMALACGATVEVAARKAGVSERTAYRRLADDAFGQRLADLRTDMLQRTAAMLTAASLEAVKTLLGLQQAGMTATVRLGAARAILELGAKFREMVELERRVVALEQKHVQPHGA